MYLARPVAERRNYPRRPRLVIAMYHLYCGIWPWLVCVCLVLVSIKRHVCPVHVQSQSLRRGGLSHQNEITASPKAKLQLYISYI